MNYKRGIAARCLPGLLAGGAVLLGAVRAGAQPPTTEIPAAPPFSAAEVTASPTTAWITNGGNVYNQRYSPLTGINRDNVAGLKAVWRTGMGSGGTGKGPWPASSVTISSGSPS